jgi:hypothetical protein
MFVGSRGIECWKHPRPGLPPLAVDFGASCLSSVEEVTVLVAEDLRLSLPDDFPLWPSAGALGVHLLPCPFDLWRG